MISNNQFRFPLFVVPFTSALLLLLPKRGGPPQIWNHYNFMFTWHVVSNRSIITVRELNKNFPNLNFFKLLFPNLVLRPLIDKPWPTRQIWSWFLITLACRLNLSSFFNIYFFIFFFLVKKTYFWFIPSESIFLNVHFLQCTEFILLKSALANSYFYGQYIFSTDLQGHNSNK